jgi:hypothetical protein
MGAGWQSPSFTAAVHLPGVSARCQNVFATRKQSGGRFVPFCRAEVVMLHKFQLLDSSSGVFIAHQLRRPQHPIGRADELRKGIQPLACLT